jgi:hypothetical protein
MLLQNHLVTDRKGLCSEPIELWIKGQWETVKLEHWMSLLSVMREGNEFQAEIKIIGPQEGGAQAGLSVSPIFGSF